LLLTKKIGIFTHQKTSSLQEAIFYNAYGITPGKLGSDLLTESTQDLATTYPHITQIANEKVLIQVVQQRKRRRRQQKRRHQQAKHRVVH